MKNTRGYKELELSRNIRKRFRDAPPTVQQTEKYLVEKFESYIRSLRFGRTFQGNDVQCYDRFQEILSNLNQINQNSFKILANTMMHIKSVGMSWKHESLKEKFLKFLFCISCDLIL